MGCTIQEENGQNFILNITLGLNFNQAAKFDNLNCTINYDKFCRFVELIFDKLKFVVVEISKERAVFKSNCVVKYVKVKLIERSKFVCLVMK